MNKQQQIISWLLTEELKRQVNHWTKQIDYAMTGDGLMYDSPEEFRVRLEDWFTNENDVTDKIGIELDILTDVDEIIGVEVMQEFRSETQDAIDAIVNYSIDEGAFADE